MYMCLFGLHMTLPTGLLFPKGFEFLHSKSWLHLQKSLIKFSEFFFNKNEFLKEIFYKNVQTLFLAYVFVDNIFADFDKSFKIWCGCFFFFDFCLVCELIFDLKTSIFEKKMQRLFLSLRNNSCGRGQSICDG